MPDEKTEVIFYSGYRAEETPRSFTVGGKRVETMEILHRWIEEGLDDRARKRFFEVKGSDGMTYKIYRDERTREWFVHQK